VNALIKGAPAESKDSYVTPERPRSYSREFALICGPPRHPIDKSPTSA